MGKVAACEEALAAVHRLKQGQRAGKALGLGAGEKDRSLIDPHRPAPSRRQRVAIGEQVFAFIAFGSPLQGQPRDRMQLRMLRLK